MHTLSIKNVLYDSFSYIISNLSVSLKIYSCFSCPSAQILCLQFILLAVLDKMRSALSEFEIKQSCIHIRFTADYHKLDTVKISFHINGFDIAIAAAVATLFAASIYTIGSKNITDNTNSSLINIVHIFDSYYSAYQVSSFLQD